MPESPGYKKQVTLNDTIHCLVYVVDTSNSSLLSQKMLDKFDAVRKKANQMGESRAASAPRSGVPPAAGSTLFPPVFLQVFPRFCS